MTNNFSSEYAFKDIFSKEYYDKLVQATQEDLVKSGFYIDHPKNKH